MQSRMGSWMMAIGVIIGIAGLAIMPAGFGENSPDRNMIGAGASIFAIGTFLVALGVYFKSLIMPAAPNQNSTPNNTPSPMRGGCDRCQTEAPVIQCKVHQQHLCGNCLSEHYDFRSCVYSPSTRRAGKALAARAR